MACIEIKLKLTYTYVPVLTALLILDFGTNKIMAWQNPHQPGWTPDGYPLTGHSGVGMPMPMPMPMPVTSQPGMPMTQQGIGLAPHEVPLAPPGIPNAPPASSMGPPTSPMAHHMTPTVPTGNKHH